MLYKSKITGIEYSKEIVSEDKEIFPGDESISLLARKGDIILTDKDNKKWICKEHSFSEQFEPV